MAIIPSQQIRIIDINNIRYSDRISKLSRCLLESDVAILNRNHLNVILVNNQTIQVSKGICFVNNILVEITQDITIDVSLGEAYLIENTVPLDENGIYYLCLYYSYRKSLTPPSAYIGLLKPSQISGNYNNSTMNFLASLDIQNSIINNVYDYDFNDPNRTRNYPKFYVSFDSLFKNYVRDEDFSRILFDLENNRLLIGSNENDFNELESHNLTPMLEEEAILTASDKASLDFFGRSVEIAKNANVIIVGSMLADANNITNVGKGYIFRYDEINKSWNEEAILIASDASSNAKLGSSCTISQDGKLVAISTSIEKVYIFRYDEINKSWNEEAILTASDGNAGDYFGYQLNSLSFSYDSSILVIGAYNANVSGNTNAGKAYIFRFDGSNWIEEAILTPNDPVSNGYFGFSTKISPDDSTVFVSATGATASGFSNVGKVYVFKFDGINWNLDSTIEPNYKESYSMFFGSDIDISDDGNRLIISDSLYSMIYIFDYDSTNQIWIQQNMITSNDNISASEKFSQSISYNSDYYSEFIISGAHLKTISLPYDGKAYFFVRRNNGDQWIEKQNLLDPAPSTSEHFGYCNSINKSRVVVSAEKATINGFSYAGKVFVYKIKYK